MICENWFLYDNGLRHEKVKMEEKLKMKKNVESDIFFEVQKYHFVFESRLIYFFSNGHIRNIVSTLPNVVKVDAENGNVVSTLFNVVQFNVELHNVVFQRC